MLVRLHGTEVERRLGAPTRLRVEEELGGAEGIAPVDAGQVAPVVATLLALAPDAPEDLRHGVVEREVEANLRGRGGHVEGLVLNDQLLVVVLRELIALEIVEEDMSDLEAGLEVRAGECDALARLDDRDRRRRDDNQLLESLEVHPELDAVVSERGQRKGRAGRKGEPEWQGRVAESSLARIADELRARVATPR